MAVARHPGRAMAKQRRPTKSVTAAPARPETVELATIAGGERVPVADVAHITPGLWPLAVPVASLTPDPRNARKHGERNRQAIRFSLEKFGQQRPVSVDADGIILAGNGTHAEGGALGWKYIAAVRSHLRGNDARAYAIADNRSGELAEWDAAELAATLEQLGDDGFNVGGLEISDEELDKLLEGNHEPAAPQQGAGPRGRAAGSGDLREQWKTIVEHASEAEQAAFLEQMVAEARKCRALTG